MPYRPLMSALALAALLVAGCSAGSEKAESPPGATQVTPDAAQESAKESGTVTEGRADTAVDPAAQAYVDAVAAEDLDALVDAFHADAQLIDVGRKFNGRDEIRAWADDEVIGGRLTVLKNTPKSNGTTLLVRFAPGGTGGFEANYEFDVRDGRIARLNLQYA
ncbi:nuclear transport factor 2 family protein [Streptomyces sp. NPDC050095]|uniref:nuclear transport factor 2 family protein n=1 Tax=unclassified Streptomyces TaxID=2593676 RepID=UPI003431BBAF